MKRGVVLTLAAALFAGASSAQQQLHGGDENHHRHHHGQHSRSVQPIGISENLFAHEGNEEALAAQDQDEESPDTPEVAHTGHSRNVVPVRVPLTEESDDLTMNLHETKEQEDQEPSKITMAHSSLPQPTLIVDATAEKNSSIQPMDQPNQQVEVKPRRLRKSLANLDEDRRDQHENESEEAQQVELEHRFMRYLQPGSFGQNETPSPTSSPTRSPRFQWQGLLSTNEDDTPVECDEFDPPTTLHEIVDSALTPDAENVNTAVHTWFFKPHNRRHLRYERTGTPRYILWQNSQNTITGTDGTSTMDDMAPCPRPRGGTIGRIRTNRIRIRDNT